MNTLTKKPFDLSRIGSILVDIAINMSRKSSRARMRQEYNDFKRQGYEVDHYNLNAPKSIVMTSPCGVTVEVRE